MVIRTSDVSLAASNFTKVTKYESVSYSGGWGSIDTAGLLSAAPQATDGAQTDEETTDKYGLYELESLNKPLDVQTQETSDVTEDMLPEEKMQFYSLEKLLNSMDDHVKTKRLSPVILLEEILQRMRERVKAMFSWPFSATASASGGTGRSAGLYQNMEITQYRSVTETTSFESTGSVVTADGKCIDFAISMQSSASFTEATNVTFDFKQLYLTDPLVINLGDNLADISDQTFYFDIDCDGEEDNISLLGRMSGFLALDRNEDGVINDGSELFGAKSGDGFKDLAVFDLDGNGWIDENDEVFNRLKIWTRDAEGNDKLVALGVAGIGAIYLGNVATDASSYDASGNVTAIARNSGIYLREDGSAGSIQHVDLAKIV